MSNTQFKGIWDTFDRIVVICCTKYIDRQVAVKKELERIGLIDRAEFFWDFPSPFTDRLKDSIHCTNYLSNRSAFNIFLNHYRVIKETFLRGFKNVLIIEDDVRFLKDGMKLADAVRSIPPDYDLALFDRSKPFDITLDEFKTLGGCHKQAKGSVDWFVFDHLTCAGCYALSRKGMLRLLECYEKPVAEPRKELVLKHNDFYFSRSELGKDVNLYFAFPNISVQSMIGSGSHCNMDEYWERNEYCGIKMNDYEMSGTIPYISQSSFMSRLDEALDRPVQRKIRNGVKPKLAYVIDYWKDIKPILTIVDDSAETVVHLGKDDDCKKKANAEYAVIWGYNTGDKNRHTLAEAIAYNIPVMLFEPGFISSGTTWVAKNELGKFLVEHSVVSDTKGQYFDAKRNTDLEDFLNSDVTIGTNDIEVAKSLRNKIVGNKISKYNHQPIYTPTIGRNRVKKVLVVDQSYGDMSIGRGCANENTFKRMLECAINENPGCDILVKTHPDTIAGKKGKKLGYYSDLMTKDYSNVYKVTMPINPYSLMDICDKVYVCTSQFGFEALMAGKEVRTFGIPWYAGWGLTKDDKTCSRRTQKRSIDELVFAFYCLYTKWAMPMKKRGSSPEEVINHMIELRRELNPLPPDTNRNKPMMKPESEYENW